MRLFSTHLNVNDSEPGLTLFERFNQKSALLYPANRNYLLARYTQPSQSLYSVN